MRGVATPLLTFKRPKVFRSALGTVYRRVWYSHCGRYRIVWRSTAFDIALPPAFFSAIRYTRGWTFVDRVMHRKLQTAQRACETHARRHTP